jgi:transcriptional regulator with GAF, ATPase, and Fis domain
MLLTKAEKNLSKVMQAVRERTISVTDAARLLGKSRRQVFRLLARVKTKAPQSPPCCTATKDAPHQQA